jgi:DNA-binding NarL/FixJ family response regulator
MNPSDDRTAILLDQHPLWLEAVEQVVTNAEVQVVGKATYPAEALRLIESLRPSVFITGIDMPPGSIDGIACLKQARQYVPNLRIVVLSMHDDPGHIDAALEAGAAAYVIKTAEPEDLAAAIRQVFDHSIYLAGSRSGWVPSRVQSIKSPGLTRREVEILQLVAEGLSNAELAKMLWVTEQTVKFHLSNIYRKLGVSNRTEASRWAQVNGLLTATPPSGQRTAVA